jgi:hypothetical protein
VFDNLFFGVEAMKAALQELSQNKILEAHQKIFSPWKVLHAIDLSIVGCLS